MLEIQGDANLCARSLLQDDRLVTDLVATDIVDTNAYVGVGINGNPDCERTINWTKQGVDKIIDGQIVSKARPELEALINPTTVIIQSVGVGSTIAFVESIRPFFDPDNESQTTAKTQKISITSQDNIVGASATAVVSLGDTGTDVSPDLKALRHSLANSTKFFVISFGSLYSLSRSADSSSGVM